MASYISLARKWRPAQFSDIVGQGAVVRTLMNAIRSERVHPAYLLTGSRGIGKTSIARILAKAIRCPHTSWESLDGHEWLRSCGECASCREIAAGTSVDVIEIDGASNNGVDAVREVRENAKYLPASGSRKIYIIDEVHMLTTAAFNALLKTIEEPPPHVLFMFATTEPHKIPSTILSRCQRFDLRRVTPGQVQARLTQVTQAEGIDFEPGSLALIARAAEGSMRDALSLLDQVIAFSGQKITTQSVRESVGLIEGQTLLGVLQGIFERQPLAALSLIEQAYQQGHDLRVLTRGLIEFLHASLLVKVGQSQPSTIELAPEEWQALQTIVAHRTTEEIELIFQVLHHGLDWIARSPQPKIVLDVLVVKCATAEALIALPSGASSAPVAPAGNPAHSKAPAVSSVQRASTAPAPPPVAAPAPVPAPAPIAAPAPAAPAPAPLAAESAATLAPAPAYSGDPARAWEELIQSIKLKRPLLASILEHGHCEHVPGQPATETCGVDDLQICFSPDASYFREQLQAKAYAEPLAQIAREFFGRALRIQLELKQLGESPAAKRARELAAREKAAREAAQNHPMIAEARALFGGELGPIELTPESKK